jgi:hypothetical protein
MSYVKDPGKEAGDRGRELHKLAFPESYAQEAEVNEDGTPKVAPEADTKVEDATSQHELPVVQDDLQTKYDALLAKYNSEVPRLHDWNRRKDEKIAELERQIKTVPTPPVGEVPALAEKDADGNVLYRSPYVTDEMRATDNYKYYLGEYGQTYAERQLESSVLAAKSTVKPVEEQVETVNAANAEAIFNQEVSQYVPAWQGVNREHKGLNYDPEFIANLQNAAPGTGSTYHQLLVSAYQSGDVARTVEIIKLCSPKPTSTRQKPGVPDELIAPGKTGGGQQTILDNNGGNVLRMADMNKLYKDYQEGKWVGKEEAYQTKKREFMQAKAEGRLI